MKNKKISLLRKKWWQDHPEARAKMRGPDNPGKAKWQGALNPMFGVHRCGPDNPNWKGGQLTSFRDGRIRCYQEAPSKKHGTQYQFESRVKAERAIGRPLKNTEIVHHINGNPADNRNSNLLICTNDYHSRLHVQIRQAGRMQ